MIERTLLWLYLTILMLLFSSSINAATSARLDDMVKHGEGTMSVMFWDVYRAALYSKQAKFNINRYPQALKITYLMDIEQQDLLDATQEQWQYLSVPNEQQVKWLAQLQLIWPDIREGNSITAVVDNQRKSHFYFTKTKQENSQLLGTIHDPQFGEHFFSIWLSEQTTRPTLRQKLINP